MDRTNRFQIPWRVFLGAAFLTLAVPIPWLFAALLAAAVHELGHIAATKLCGVKIQEIHVGLCGAKILIPPMEAGQQLFCLLSGPAASFLLLLLRHCFPRIAICGFIQGVFNLLPWGESDGANALGCVRRMEIRRNIACKRRKHRVQ